MISNCGHDERGKYSGGKAGDQTGTEWQVINWYNRPWKCVLRHPDAATRKLIAQMAKAAAVNNMVGYCQSHRGTFERSAAYQWSVSCESSSSVQLNRRGVHKHRTDTVRNIRRLLFKNGNGIRHRKNPDRCIRVSFIFPCHRFHFL